MPGPPAGIRIVTLGAVVGLGLCAACFRAPRHAVPEPEPVTLEIQNHAFADMDVYAVTSAGGSPAVRLAMVTGLSSTRVSIRRAHLQPGGVLQLQLHGIGTRTQWVSPPLSVSPGERVALEINADATGNMSHTVFYPLPRIDSVAVSAGMGWHRPLVVLRSPEPPLMLR